MRLTEETASIFARIALGHVTREYPNKLDHVLAGPSDAATPRVLHPVFYGSLDWHSCVHGYWMLARLLRRFPGMEIATSIRTLFDDTLTPALIERECAYFQHPTARGFERPYGWAWLLKLAAEVRTLGQESWNAALMPLASVIVARFRAFLPLATYPVRAGTHGNTAFALALAVDYAASVKDDGLIDLVRSTALRWYGADVDCQAWEPGGDDFLSPALVEAECLRRLLAPDAFALWFDRFLPRLALGHPATLFSPVATTDRTDGKLAHLDGLNLSRAWCWRALATALPEADPRRPRMLDAAARHLAAGLPFVEGNYVGEHWLASFAVLAMDE